MRFFLFLVALVCAVVSSSLLAEEIKGDKLLATEQLKGKDVFVDPAIRGKQSRVTVWFDEQFLGDGKAYPRRAKEFSKWKRSDLRRAVMHTLETISDRSYMQAKKHLDKLLEAGSLQNLQRHWIVNGFTCTADQEGLKALEKVPGVKAIFSTRSRFFGRKGPAKGTFFEPVANRPKFDPTRYLHPWYTRNLKADQVWKKFGVTGAGTLNVVHDFNFVFSDNLTPNLYRNAKEIPGNGKDDDNNGLIDDYHGYNFATNSPQLTQQAVAAGAANPRPMHGFMCAAIMVGSGAEGKKYEFGLAPEGQWAGVIAGGNVEAAVEWAIEQGADTYSMSFSQPNLGEYRSHWRKIMEHGSFCGVCFVSGAGNFAQSAKIPMQMRVPEDIPNAVFAATGVQRDFGRTPFSSMGPVQWETEFYADGKVDKPEVCAFNAGLPLLKLDGTVVPVAINGNSFAGPMQGGSIALMLSADPDLLPWDVRDILTATATDVSKKGYDYETGHGLINCYRAVKEVLRRKAVREGKDTTAYQGREKGDEWDIAELRKNLKPVIGVAFVQANGQAAKLGVKKGDILISYNGVKITKRADLLAAKNQAKDAKAIPVVIDRNGKEMRLEFTPGPLGFVPTISFGQPVFE